MTVHMLMFALIQFSSLWMEVIHHSRRDAEIIMYTVQILTHDIHHNVQEATLHLTAAATPVAP